jgi:hypothetical protein
MKKRLILIPILIILLAITVQGFSMSPGSYRFQYDEINGNYEEFSFHLRSASQTPIMIDIRVGRELGEYLDVNTEPIMINPKESATIPIKLNLPPGLDNVGTQRASITFTKRVPDDRGGFMAITTAYEGIILITFSYPGEYITIRKLEPLNINQNENTQIDWGVQALGLEITSFIADLKIKNANEETIYQKEYPRMYLARNEMYDDIVNLQSEQYPPGNYEVILTATSQNNTDTRTKILRIGEEDLQLVDFTPKNFTIGQIFKFGFTIESLWNDEFNNVYGILRAGGETTTTRSINLPAFEKVKIDNQYIDISTLDEGKHNATLEIHFGENTKIYEIELIGQKPQKNNNFLEDNMLTILYVAIIILLIIGALLIIIFINHHKDKKLKKK